jgi:hypothetical protein
VRSACTWRRQRPDDRALVTAGTAIEWRPPVIRRSLTALTGSILRAHQLWMDGQILFRLAGSHVREVNPGRYQGIARVRPLARGATFASGKQPWR